MRKRIRKLCVSVFVVMLVACQFGCANPDPTFLNKQTVAMIERLVEQDTEGAYALFHPDVKDFEGFRSSMEKIYAYFPVTAGYLWRLTQYSNYKGVGSNHSEYYKGQYEVQTDGKIYVILVEWISNDNGSGFQKFHVVSEEDLNEGKLV